MFYLQSCGTQHNTKSNGQLNHTLTGKLPGGNFVVSKSLILLTAFTLFAKISSNGNNSSVFNGNCSVNHTDGRKLFIYSFSFAGGGSGCANLTVAEDFLAGCIIAEGGMSTLFLPIGTHSLSSRTKLLCLLLSLSIGIPKLGFSATRKPSSSSSNSNGITCSPPVT